MIKPVASFTQAKWQSIRASYWFVPVCMMLIAFCLGYACIYYTPVFISESLFRDYLPTVPADTASDLISAIATSIITATSIAFSMTLVALTMASSQFGPRLLQTFMDDRGTQLVLGFFTSTFVFCLIALHRVSVSDTDAITSSALAVLVLVIGIFDTLVLIYYIHHIARFIQVDEIISRCYHECIHSLSHLFTLTDEKKNHQCLKPSAVVDSPVITELSLTESGYVQTVDYHHLLDQDGIQGIDILVRAGDHVVPNETLLRIHSTTQIDDERKHYCLSCIVLGKKRTSLQDPEFSVSQLVEIALRALSPGINDPITAMTCADRLTSVCILMAEHQFPSQAMRNTNTNIWLKRRTYTYESVLNTAFDQLRQAGEKHIDVMIHLVRCLNVMRKQLPQEYIQAVDTQISAVNDLVSAHIGCDKDRNDVTAVVNIGKQLH
ncbi:DUF2254 domain-containing protein [Vibrio sp. AK197]